MNRRAFVSLSAVSPLAHLLPALAQEPARNPGEVSVDVAVIGAGVGGVACALAAARNGLRVVLTEQYDWIGGQLTSQAVPPDEYPQVESFPCTKLYGTFRTKVRDFYRRAYPLTDAARAKPDLNPGNGTVSKLCHEPRVALAVLLELLAPYLSTGRVRLFQPYIPVSADLEGDRVRAVTVVSEFGRPVAVVAPYFVDATETGDLLPITRTEWVTGAEAQRDTLEPSAPPAADPRNHQACTVCFAMDYDDGQDHTIPEPPEYRRWKEYVPRMRPVWPGPLFSWTMSHPVTLRPREMAFDPTGRLPREGPNLWTYRRIVDRANFAPGTYAGDVCLVNWPQNDYWLGNLFDVPAPDAAVALEAARSLSRCPFHPRRPSVRGASVCIQ